jgi:hypothetical protein
MARAKEALERDFQEAQPSRVVSIAGGHRRLLCSYLDDVRSSDASAISSAQFFYQAQRY